MDGIVWHGSHYATNHGTIGNMKTYPIIGWREWIGLPDLGIEKIKAKIDTGARTSALHAFELKPFSDQGVNKIHFSIHPLQHNMQIVVQCVANILGKRVVTDSGGHQEERFVIQTTLSLFDQNWPIEVTLTERENMLFRMLLGRHALRKRFLVHPARSFLSRKQQ